MRTADDHPVGPEIEAALAAIDATLAGDAVDPSHAELAELALILAADRPQPTATFTAALDRQVAARFGGEGRRRRGRRWLFAPAAGLAAAMAVAVVVVLSPGASRPVNYNSLEVLTSAGASHSAPSTIVPAAGPAKRVPPTSFGSSTTAGSAGQRGSGSSAAASTSAE